VAATPASCLVWVFFSSAAVLDVFVSCLSVFLVVVVVFSGSRVVLGVAVGTSLVEFL
jgi:hypothetical protein